MTLQLTLDSYMLPISGSAPSGEKLRYTVVYDNIKEAKRADDQLERGEWQTDLKRSNWAEVIKLCSEALLEKTKDLQIAAWLTEALVYQHGFSGLAFGLELVSNLLVDFWDTVYPEIEDGDLEYRIGPLSYLNEKIPAAVGQIPLCDPKHSKGFNYYNLEESRKLGPDSHSGNEPNNRRLEVSNGGKTGGDDFTTAINMSSLSFYKEVCKQLTLCMDKIKALDEITTERFSHDPPGFSMLTNSVVACLRVVEKIYSEKQKSEIDESDVEEFDTPTDDNVQETFAGLDVSNTDTVGERFFSKQNAISDISSEEQNIWNKVVRKAGNGSLKSALDQLSAAAALSPSMRQKNRYLLLVAKLCIKANRPDLAKPIVEQLYKFIEIHELEKWEHPAWIADIIETLYRCIDSEKGGDSERAAQLFQKLCTLNITKAATFKMGGM